MLKPHDITINPQTHAIKIETYVCLECNYVITSDELDIKDKNSPSKLFCDQCFKSYDMDTLYERQLKAKLKGFQKFIRATLKKVEEDKIVKSISPELLTFGQCFIYEPSEVNPLKEETLKNRPDIQVHDLSDKALEVLHNVYESSSNTIDINTLDSKTHNELLCLGIVDFCNETYSMVIAADCVVYTKEKKIVILYHFPVSNIKCSSFGFGDCNSPANGIMYLLSTQEYQMLSFFKIIDNRPVLVSDLLATRDNIETLQSLKNKKVIAETRCDVRYVKVIADCSVLPVAATIFQDDLKLVVFDRTDQRQENYPDIKT